MLVTLESLSAVLVMISSKSVSICNHSHARLVDSSRNHAESSNIGGLHSAVGLSLLRARRSGTHCRQSFVVSNSFDDFRHTLKTVLFAPY